MKKKVIAVICFLIILFVTLWKVSDVLSFKFAEGNTIVGDFYKLDKNKVDVLFVGSSHCYVNFNNGELWDDYGIASYNLGSSDQPMWNTYYYVKEALKTQKPKLIVLEAYGLTYDFEYSEESRIIKSTYGLRWSADKIKNVLVSTPPGTRKSFLVEYGRYHSRYSSLNQGDFYQDSEYLDSTNYWHYKGTKGQYLIGRINPITLNDVSGITESSDIHPKAEEYYRKILELAKEKNIPIAVVVTPFDVMDPSEQSKLIRGAEIAAEYDVKFLNCNLLYDEIGMDGWDYYDLVHMTESGSRKFSKYIGAYLTENYDLPDRRGDKGYDSWQYTADYTREFAINTRLKNCYDYNEIKEYLEVDGHVIFVARNDEQKSMCIIEGGESVWSSDEACAPKYVSYKFHDICMSSGEDGNNSIVVDGNRVKQVANGITFVVYDKFTETIVDSFVVDFDNNNAISR